MNSLALIGFVGMLLGLALWSWNLIRTWEPQRIPTAEQTPYTRFLRLTTTVLSFLIMAQLVRSGLWFMGLLSERTFQRFDAWFTLLVLPFLILQISLALLDWRIRHDRQQATRVLAHLLHVAGPGDDLPLDRRAVRLYTGISYALGVVGWYQFVLALLAIVTGHIAYGEVQHASNARTAKRIVLGALILGYTMFALHLVPWLLQHLGEAVHVLEQ